MTRQRLLERGAVPVVEELGAHDEVEGAGRPLLGSVRRSTRTWSCAARRSRAASTAGCGDVDGEQRVAACGEHRGEDADRAARLEGARVAAVAERCQRARVLVVLVGARLEVPRVGIGGVASLEVLALQASPVDRLASGAHEQGVEAVLEQEDAQVAARRGPGRRRGPAAASRRRAAPRRRAPARRGRPPRAGARTARAATRRGARPPGARPRPATGRSVCACVSIRPTASAARSSPASARGASASSAAARAASAMPAQLAAVRMASRPNHGSRSSSSGPPSSACTRAPWKCTRWLSEARMPGAGEPRAVDLDALGEVDVGDAAGVAVARQHERAMQAAGARAEGLDALEGQPVGGAHHAGRLALAGHRVGAPHAQPALSGRDLLEVGAAQRLVGQQLDALDRVVGGRPGSARPSRRPGPPRARAPTPRRSARRCPSAPARASAVMASAGKAGSRSRAVAPAATSASARCRAEQGGGASRRRLGRDQRA